jgi:hypothetical protein
MAGITALLVELTNPFNIFSLPRQLFGFSVGLLFSGTFRILRIDPLFSNDTFGRAERD